MALPRALAGKTVGMGICGLTVRMDQEQCETHDSGCCSCENVKVKLQFMILGPISPTFIHESH